MNDEEDEEVEREEPRSALFVISRFFCPFCMFALVFLIVTQLSLSLSLPRARFLRCAKSREIVVSVCISVLSLCVVFFHFSPCSRLSTLSCSHFLVSRQRALCPSLFLSLSLSLSLARAHFFRYAKLADGDRLI